MKPCFLLLSAALFVAGCSGGAGKPDKLANRDSLASAAVNQVVGIGKIQPENDIIQLNSQVSGQVVKILKKENDSVAAGEIVLELDHQVDDAKIKQYQDQVRTQSAQINVDEAAILEFNAKYENAVKQEQRLESLLAKGAETQQAVDDANTNLQSFKSNVERLKASIQVSKSKLSETKAALLVSEKERDQKIIRSPVRGKILDISAITGSAVDTKLSLAQISPQGRIIADCEIDELFADKVQEGQKAWIRNPGSLDTLSTGLVYFSASFLRKKSLFTDESGEKEDRRVREIKIALDHPENLLLNARVECVVEIAPKGNTRNQ